MRQIVLWIRAIMKAPVDRFAPLLAAFPILVGIACAHSWPGMGQLIAGGAAILVFVFISHWLYSRGRK